MTTRRPSLSSSPFRSSLLIIAALAVFIGIFWIINTYQTYRQSITNIQESYQELYRERVQEEVKNVLELIEDRRSQSELRIENELREKVQSAYTIASHIYSLYKDDKDVDQLRSMVAEILRPIRWDNGLGYYFAGRVEGDTVDLFANDPALEGQGLGQILDQNGRPVAEDIIKMLKEKGAGMYRYPPGGEDSRGMTFPGILFIKYFKPFDWYIGARISNAAMEQRLQEEIIDTVQNMRFSGDGHIFFFRFDGTIISHPNKNLIGRSIIDLFSEDGEAYGRAMLTSGLHSGSGGNVRYRAAGHSSESEQQRLCFVNSYPAWNWIVVADISMDAMEKAIQEEKLTYTASTLKNVLIFIGFFAVAVLLLLSMAYYHSIRIKHGISLFTDFFRKAAHTQVKIKNADLAFAEFETLGRLANTMVDDRIQQEQILRRDELRLDTLLQLGSMDEFTIKDKYDFVLHRIVQITGSNEGYIALVNHGRTHTTLCSRVTVGTGQIGLSSENDTSPRPVENCGVTGSCIRKNKVSIVNNGTATDRDNFFPYGRQTRRRIDVPIIYNNTVVLVAGVCNGTRDYDNSDVRQMTMLLEGMWLHIQKICSEKEMAKLERQIIAISQEERSKIGRDLHDDLGSHLSGVELLSKVLQQKLERQSSQQAAQMATIRNLIRDAIEKTRRLSRGLYPVHVIEHGLEAAIEELLAEIEQLYTVHCSLAFDQQVEPLAVDIAPHVYYIIREALFNAARHARPDTIRVVIQRNGKQLRVTVLDDGRGIMEQQEKKGLGLHTMQYRAKAIGATLTIRPGAKSGTVVTLCGEVYL